MSYWNYRVVKTYEDEFETLYGICEVYYDDDGNPIRRTDPVPVEGEYVCLILERMQEALEKPTLNLDLTEIKF